MKAEKLINEMVNKGFLNQIDRYFAFFAAKLACVQNDDPLTLAAALTSWNSSVRNGICLPVRKINTGRGIREFMGIPQKEIPDELFPEDDWLPLPLAEKYPGAVSKDGHMTLLAEAHDCLYLSSHFRQENYLYDFLLKKAAEPVTQLFSEEEIKAVTTLPLTPEQLHTIQIAKESRFLLISGGPGTGKTTIISILLAMRSETLGNGPFQVHLCAFTGKAAARMKDAIRDELENHITIQDQARKKAIADIQAYTIHSLLKFNPQTGKFRYTKENKLPCKLLIVDEASMVSMSLMAKLFEALPEDASIFILGDRGQLASVGPGAVFADFCGILQNYPDHMSILRESKRFHPDKGIGKIKDQLDPDQIGPGEKAWEILLHNPTQLLHSFPPDDPGTLDSFLLERIAHSQLREEGWIKNGKFYYERENIDQAWEQFESLRIISASNIGDLGVDALNVRLRSLLGFPDSPSKPGMTFMVLKNDYSVDLHNGDIGILWYADGPNAPHVCTKEDPGTGLPLLVFFKDFKNQNGSETQGCWRGIPFGRLPEHTDAYAITVHKSQGSGYGRVLFFLPEIPGGHGENLLTRELIYTALTRAKKQAEAVCSEKNFVQAANRKVERISGLSQKIPGDKKTAGTI